MTLSIAGGLATGADETKTESDRIGYGGLANAILDPCYHQVIIAVAIIIITSYSIV